MISKGIGWEIFVQNENGVSIKKAEIDLANTTKAKSKHP